MAHWVSLKLDSRCRRLPVASFRSSWAASSTVITLPGCLRPQVLNPAVTPGQEWWLDAEAARAAAAFPLGSPGGPPCSRALTFTLRPGAPIHLTREQVGTSIAVPFCSMHLVYVEPCLLALWCGVQSRCRQATDLAVHTTAVKTPDFYAAF